MIKHLSCLLPAALLGLFFSFSSYAAEIVVDVPQIPLGKVPCGWQDHGTPKVNANWARDGKGFLRVMNKMETGLLVLPVKMKEGEVRVSFSKALDGDVYFGAMQRYQDSQNYYAARFYGNDRIALVKVLNGEESILIEWVTRSRYQEGELWQLSLAIKGKILTAQVYDKNGMMVGRIDFLDEEPLAPGAVGLNASTYAGASRVRILTGETLEMPKPAKCKGVNPKILKPVPLEKMKELNTPFAQLSSDYDVVVAGAGAGGWGAAVQAARMGVKVLLVEESDWIGGQMSAAAVTSMDESGVWEKFPVRERGLYREFHESIVNAYQTKNKDPFRAYYAWPDQLEGGYEPMWVKATLYAFIEDLRKSGAVIDLVLEARVKEVLKEGQAIKGVVVAQADSKKSVNCKVLIDATEYGDVIPLTGEDYRLGTVKSNALDMKAPVQYHTWLAVIREYPEGIPEHLRIKQPAPGYLAKRFAKSQMHGTMLWGSPGKGYKGPRIWRVLAAWRGMAEMASPMTGTSSEKRHTKCGFNGGRQDYPVTVGSIENEDERLAAEREGVYRALHEIYYFQNELGLNWAPAEEEGFNTEYNREMMRRRGIREDLLEVASRLPCIPYVREARRGRGLYTLRAEEMGRFEEAKLFPNSVAMGDYFMDIDHGKTGGDLEPDLDKVKPPREGGPVQVTFEAFVARKVDGLLFTEKNISQSRMVNGATRLQPIAILTGQASGAIAAQSVLKGVQPRNVNPIEVQATLLASGSNLIQRWYEDVKWGSPLWQATQLLSLHSVFDVPGPFNKKKEQSVGGDNFWKPGDELDRDAFMKSVQRLGELSGKKIKVRKGSMSWAYVKEQLSVIDSGVGEIISNLGIDENGKVTRGGYALVSAEVLKRVCRPTLLSDPDQSEWK